jgi:hypothetical protein
MSALGHVAQDHGHGHVVHGDAEIDTQCGKILHIICSIKSYMISQTFSNTLCS